MAPSEKWILDLDWANENDPIGISAAFRLDLARETLVEVGPGGGWPIIRFSGEFNKLNTLRNEYDPHNDSGCEILQMCDCCDAVDNDDIMDGICAMCRSDSILANEGQDKCLTFKQVDDRVSSTSEYVLLITEDGLTKLDSPRIIGPFPTFGLAENWMLADPHTSLRMEIVELFEPTIDDLYRDKG